MPQAAILQVVAGQLAHLHQESQVAPLCCRTTARPLKDFDYSDDLLLDANTSQHQQTVRGIAGLVVAGRAGLRRNERRLPAGQDILNQTPMSQ